MPRIEIDIPDEYSKLIQDDDTMNAIRRAVGTILVNANMPRIRTSTPLRRGMDAEAVVQTATDEQARKKAHEQLFASGPDEVQKRAAQTIEAAKSENRF
jgi:hypothetical protein